MSLSDLWYLFVWGGALGLATYVMLAEFKRGGP